LNARALWLLGLLALPAFDAKADIAKPNAFQFERRIIVASPGPQKLPVDMDLLAGAAPGLSLADLRIFDAAGVEVAYLMVPPNRQRDVWQPAQQVIATPQTKTDSGFEADLGAVFDIDRVQVLGLPAPLMKRIKVEASADRSHYNVVAADRTIFDLPAQGLKDLDVDFAPGRYRYLRGTWDDRSTSPVAPPGRVFAHRSSEVLPTPPLVAPVPFERQPSKPAVSRFRIRLPAKGLAVAALDLQVGESEVYRQATVSEPRLLGRQLEPVKLGSALLKRTARGELTAAELRIVIDAPRGSELDLSVDNGNNPPLDLKEVRAVVAAQPFVFFEAKTAGTLTARFGNPKAERPRYDLEAVGGAIPQNLSLASFEGRGNQQPTQLPEPAAATSSPVLPGAVVDLGAFAYVRHVLAGKPGLVSLRLDAPVLAHSRQLEDVRIVDRAGRQVPYLVERDADPLSIGISVERLATPTAGLPARHSHYRIKLPYATIAAARIELVTSARVFQRTVSLWIDVTDTNREPARSRWSVVRQQPWQHANREEPAPSVTFDLPGGDDFVVGIDDGDNSALTITQANLLVPAFRLRFFRTADEDLALAYGNPTLSGPHYDLSLIAPELEGVPEEDAALQAEPADRHDPRPSDSATRWFWASLVAAVAVLVALIARLMKRPSSGAQEKADGGEKPAP
jgi:hypothetical protein